MNEIHYGQRVGRCDRPDEPPRPPAPRMSPPTVHRMRYAPSVALRFVTLTVTSALVAACGDDPKSIALDTTAPSADTGADVDTPAPDVSDTSTEPDTSGPDTSDTPVGPDTSDPDTSDTPVGPDISDPDTSDTSIGHDTSDPDTSETSVGHDTSDPDAITPECIEDLDCASGRIAPPNACLALRCIDGICQFGPRLCDDEDPCTLDACDPRSGCMNLELTVDVGPSRFYLCPTALTQSEAAAACLARGSELATLDESADAGAIAALLNDYGFDSAFVSSFSASHCSEGKRIYRPPCRALGADACTLEESCFSELPFACEIHCNDGDPCTRDFVGPDGLCASDDGSCDDGDACTVDSCDPRFGCVHEIPDGTCVDTNPCTTDRCDPQTGACTYELVRRPWAHQRELLECPGALTWQAARAMCADSGAILANPTTDAQRDLLANLTRSLRATSTLWAPLRQQEGGNEPWYWVDGGGTGTPLWCTDVVPNYHEGGHCGLWDPSRGCYADSPCEIPHSFGCVIDLSIP